MTDAWVMYFPGVSQGGATWCLLAFICANYCKDPYKGVKSPRPDSKLDTDHLTQKTQEFVTPFTTTMPFL